MFLLLALLFGGSTIVRCENASSTDGAHRPAKSLVAKTKTATTEIKVPDAPPNTGTSSLAGIEFNTPYSHEIAALTIVLAVVAAMSLILAVKFTRTSSAAADSTNSFKSAGRSDDASTVDEDTDEEEDGDEEPGERAPIMHLFHFSKPSSGYTYESLIQTRESRGRRFPGHCSGRGVAAAVVRFNARLDEPNGLLCLHGVRLRLRAVEDFQQRNLSGWGLAIDIVAQTDAECRQIRLQTRLAAAAETDQDEAAREAGWVSEPIEDVLAVRVKQVPSGQPPRGRLLIRALALQNSAGPTHPAEDPNQKPHSSDSSVSSALKLGGATFPLSRISRLVVTNLEVTLRDRA